METTAIFKDRFSSNQVYSFASAYVEEDADLSPHYNLAL